MSINLSKITEMPSIAPISRDATALLYLVGSLLYIRCINSSVLPEQCAVSPLLPCVLYLQTYCFPIIISYTFIYPCTFHHLYKIASPTSFKIVSVIFPIIFLGLSRVAIYEKKQGKHWAALQKNWVLFVLFGVIFLNIMEATVKDLQTGNYFNALCGFLLCVTMPYAPKFWKFSLDNGDRADLMAYTTLAWNFLYTTWNLCFVYGESHIYFASSVCILLAAEIYPLIKRRPELYITARAYTLATHMIFRACFPNLFPAVMDSSA